jgi:subtilisin family serine protease
MNILKYFLFFIISIFTLQNTFADSEDYVKGNVIIQTTSNKVLRHFTEEIFKDLKVKVSYSILSSGANIWLLTFDESQINTKEFLKSISKYNVIEAAQLNHSNITKRDNTPNDPSLNLQWGHINNGGGSSVIDADMDSDEAWEITTGGYTQNGDRIVVAVIDEGVEIDHEDLTIWTNKHEIPDNNIDDDNNGFVDDIHGYDFFDDNGEIESSSHGTHVAGIIGAKGNNCTGVVGVNWDVEIMAIRGSSTVESKVIKAYDYVWQMRERYNRTNGDSGAYVVATNSSFGVDRADPNDYPLWCEFYNTLGEAGILNAVAGPNLNINIDNEGDVPGACLSDYTICVTNTNSSDIRSAAGYGTINFDIGAPGSLIYSTIPSSNYSNKSGTSMATPQVAGAVALMQSALSSEKLNNANPDELALYLKGQMLNFGVDSIFNFNDPDNATNTVSSKGRLNLFKCVTAVSANVQSLITEPTCGAADGIINLIPYGSFTPFTYNWSTGKSTASLTGLSPGAYSVSTTDSNGCINTKTITLTDSPVINHTITESKCKGVDNGIISVTSNGINTPYFYLWQDGSTTNNLSNLTSSTYALTVTSTSGCMLETVFSLNDSLTNTTIETTLQHDTCGANVGRVIVNIPSFSLFNYGICDGTSSTVYTSSPYSYTWDNGFTTDTLKNLTSGSFSLTATTNGGCVFDTTYNINSLILPGSLTIYDSTLHLSCFGDTDGFIRIDSIKGGSTPFSYLWSNSNTSTLVINLAKETYNLTITDINGCVQHESYPINEPSEININIITTPMSGKDANDGSLEATPTGGTPPFTFEWSTGLSDALITDLSYDDYSITVTDFNGCTNNKTATIDYVSGINDRDLSNINIFPNPTNGLVYIQSENTINQIRLFDSIGRLIMTANNTSKIDLTTLSKGIYVVEISDISENSFNYKLIKE